MNDQGSGRSPEFDDDDDDDKRRVQGVQRAFMDRARRAVEHEQAPTPRRVGHRVVAFVAALALTFTIVFVFDAFLSSMQKVMRMIDEQEATPAAGRNRAQEERTDTGLRRACGLSRTASLPPPVDGESKPATPRRTRSLP